MHRPTAALAVRLVLATAAATAPVAGAGALPPTAAAKGVAAATVCGADGCHPVGRAAVRTGFEAFRPARAPRRAEPFFTVHLKARVSSGKVVDVFRLDWLPRAGLTRQTVDDVWTRPSPGFARALRRATAGLTAHPAAGFGPATEAPRRATVVETFAPAGTASAPATARGDGPGAALAVPGLVALIAATAFAAVRRRGRRPARAR
jgi:hypothetical protein